MTPSVLDVLVLAVIFKLSNNVSDSIFSTNVEQSFEGKISQRAVDWSLNRLASLGLIDIEDYDKDGVHLMEVTFITSKGLEWLADRGSTSIAVSEYLDNRMSAVDALKG